MEQGSRGCADQVSNVGAGDEDKSDGADADAAVVGDATSMATAAAAAVAKGDRSLLSHTEKVTQKEFFTGHSAAEVSDACFTVVCDSQIENREPDSVTCFQVDQSNSPESLVSEVCVEGQKSSLESTDQVVKPPACDPGVGACEFPLNSGEISDTVDKHGLRAGETTEYVNPSIVSEEREGNQLQHKDPRLDVPKQAKCARKDCNSPTTHESDTDSSTSSHLCQSFPVSPVPSDGRLTPRRSHGNEHSHNHIV